MCEIVRASAKALSGTGPFVFLYKPEMDIRIMNHYESTFPAPAHARHDATASHLPMGRYTRGRGKGEGRREEEEYTGK